MARGVKSTFDGADEAVVGESTRVRGRVVGEGNLRVLGEIEGDIALEGTLSVAEGGTVSANVQATAAFVEGTIDGDIDASEGVTIAASGRVNGVIRAAGLTIEEGASISGRVETDFEMPEELTG